MEIYHVKLSKLFILIIALTFSFEALAWRCTAASPSGWGVGYSDWRGTAIDIALYECAVNTPYGQACYIQRCDPYRAANDDNSSGGAGLPKAFGSDYTLKYSDNPAETSGGIMAIE